MHFWKINLCQSIFFSNLISMWESFSHFPKKCRFAFRTKSWVFWLPHHRKKPNFWNLCQHYLVRVKMLRSIYKWLVIMFYLKDSYQQGEYKNCFVCHNSKFRPIQNLDLYSRNLVDRKLWMGLILYCFNKI